MLVRSPIPRLRPFVRTLWVSEDGDGAMAGPSRERLLPTGFMHLALRTEGDEIRTFHGADDLAGRALGHAVVGGARTAPYVRDASPGVRSVGAMLQPGAARLLFGAPAGELAERHTRLDDLWGRAAADELLGRLASAEGTADRLARLEALLCARLPQVRSLHPAVAEALARFPAGAVRDAVERSGLSHRRFIALYRDATGLAPKAHARVLRFQAAVALLSRHPDVALAAVALRAGYADQAHLSREFRALAGVSPGAYRRLAPASPNHVPVERAGR